MTLTLMRWPLRLLLGLAIAAPVCAQSARSTALDRVLANALIVRSEAEDVGWQLDTKSPDYAGLRRRVLGLEGHAAALDQSIADFEVAGVPLTPEERIAFERAKAAASTLGALLAEKAAGLSTAAATPRDRRTLRMQAESIAESAATVSEEFGRLRG